MSITSHSTQRPQTQWQPDGVEHRGRESFLRHAVRIGAVAAFGVLAVVGVKELKGMDDAHKQAVAVEAAERAVDGSRPATVDINTTIYFREGVTVRTEPKVIPRTKQDRGNELKTLGSGEILAVSNPVNIENEDGKKFVAFTIEDDDGGVRTGYVASSVLGQVNKAGEHYAIVAPEQQPKLPEGLDSSAVEFDEQTALFTLDGHHVGVAHEMSPEEALVDMA